MDRLAVFTNSSLKKSFMLIAFLIFLMIVITLNGTNLIISNEKKIKFVKKNERTFSFSEFEIIHQHEDFTSTAKNSDLSSTTVISIYFELIQSKHTLKEYAQWIETFAHSIRSPLAILVSQSAYLKLRELRINFTTKFYVVDDIWLIMKDLEFERAKSYIFEYLHTQNAKDPEFFRHNSNLYAIWNLKSFICHRIARENPFNSSFFIYTDAGSWRQGIFHDWPDTEFISKRLVQELDNRVLFGQIDKFKYFDENLNIIEGTFFAGTAKAVRDFYHNFFYIHEERFQKGLFIGKDQTIMNLLAFQYFPQTVVRLSAWNLNCPFRNNPWWYFQQYFSHNSSLYCVDDRIKVLVEL